MGDWRGHFIRLSLPNLADPYVRRRSPESPVKDSSQERGVHLPVNLTSEGDGEDRTFGRRVEDPSHSSPAPGPPDGGQTLPTSERTVPPTRGTSEGTTPGPRVRPR